MQPAMNRTPLEEQLVREATAMASYALASGKVLPVSVVQILQASLLASEPANEPGSVCGIDVGALSWAHAQLTRLVAPAAPRAVLLLADQPGSRGRWSIFGPIRLVRYLLGLAFVSVLGLLFIGATEQVSLAPANIFSLTGLPSILNSLFLLCAASVGAAFSGLFRINLYIAATTYDPKHDASYWVQYGLGVIAGVLLATLIPVTEATGSAITRPALALVGGFSASLLYRIMDRLSRSIESMVAGTTYSASPPEAGGQPNLSPPPEGSATSTDELLITLKRLMTVVGQAQGQPDDDQALPEPRDKQLAAAPKAPSNNEFPEFRRSLNRSSRSDGVIPFWADLMPFDIESSHSSVADLHAGRVVAWLEYGVDG
jgi:hypothetical protein